MSEPDRLLKAIRRDMDQIESPVSQTVSAEYVVRIGQTLAANVRRLDAIIVESGCLPDDWEEPVVQRIEDEEGE